ncbi:MAG: hypothetical protein JXB88_19685 [Spirochaetales bacterium]|nr:hypothetical protein [Spirochaetales bacterium]
MKQLLFILLFMFIVLLFLNADDSYKPVAKTDAPDFWWYYISARSDSNADAQKAINTIILPSELEPGLYKTYYYYSTSSDDFMEVVDGPGGRIKGPLNQYIYPHYINAFYKSAPCTYPFKIHVIINPSTEVTPDKKDQKWIIPAKMNIIIKKKNDSIYDLSHYHAKYTFNSITYNSLSNIEFDLEPDTYAIFIPEDGLYTYYEEKCSFNPYTSSYEPCTRYVHTHVFNYIIYLVIDRAGPQRPEEPWLAESAYQYKIENNYYTNESNGIDNNMVSFEWFPVADNGIIFNSAVPEYCSGTAGYYVNIYNYKNNSLIKTETIIDDTTDENFDNTITHMISLDEGDYFVRIQAYDKYGNDGQESFPGNPPSRFIVDRTAPEKAVNVRLHQPVSVAGKGVYAAPSYTLLWDKCNDLPEVNADTGGYELCIQNISAGTEENLTVNVSGLIDSENPARFMENQASGEYTVMIQAYDRLFNRGEWSDPVFFFVDASPPEAPVAETFIINDPYAVKEINSDEVRFTTTMEDTEVSFTPADDGPEPWQSGVLSYTAFEIKSGNLLQLSGERVAITTETITLSCTDLVCGENTFIIHAVDAVGNQGPGTTIIINKTELSPVTFPSPCYTYENNEYSLLWNAPATIPQGASIVFYKVIIKGITGSTPAADDFAVVPELTEEQAPLTGIPQGEEQVAYVQASDTLGNTSLGVKTFHLPPLTIEPGEPYELPDDEYWWSGLHEIEATVIVPEGTTLTVLPGAEVRVKANTGIRFIIHGILAIQGTEANPVLFNADHPGYTGWEGIHVTGEADILHGVIRHAVRGITAAPGSAITIENTRFIHNRVGLHSYGEAPVVTGTLFEDCQWYGVKEDASSEYGEKRPVLTRCIFNQNGYDYYHEQDRDITMEELNQLPGNSENRRED